MGQLAGHMIVPQICCHIFHHSFSLGLRRICCEDFRMFCLGYPQVKIPVELLSIGIIMGMDHPGIRRISDRVTRFHSFRRIDHIFIKYGMFYESTQFFIDLPAICRTHIGAEKCLDPQYLKIFCGFDP